MRKIVKIDGVDLILGSPDEITQFQWIGGEMYMSQLLAAWTIVDPKNDISMNPQVLGKPGVGKTTLAYSAAKMLGLPVYIFQCTVDTRPEDLLITPVIGENHSIQYHASSLVSAMLEGGVCILDEANRMAEKSWASLAPLLDQRRYVESIIAGVKIPAHPNFRICVTMNEDSSTFEIPEYIHSRLQPQIYIEFPDQEEEFKILEFNLPFAPKEIIDFTVKFLQKSHKANRDYTVRDGINICRYYLKMEDYYYQNYQKKKSIPKVDKNTFNRKLFQQAIFQILGQEGFKFYIGKDLDEFASKHQFQDIFDRLNSIFFSDKIEDDDISDEILTDELDDDEPLDEEGDEDLFFSNSNRRNQRSPSDYDDEEDDMIHIFEDEEKRENRTRRNRKGILEPIVDNDLDEGQNFKDPNEIIREFLKRKNSEKKNHVGQKNKKSPKTPSDGEEEIDGNDNL